VAASSKVQHQLSRRVLLVAWVDFAARLVGGAAGSAPWPRSNTPLSHFTATPLSLMTALMSGKARAVSSTLLRRRLW
jgi:hypothetical protein